VILAAGTIGTTRVLLNTAKNNPAIANPRIGKGLILHPSVPMIGIFDRQINLLEGLDSATFVDAFGAMPGFIFETMGGLPGYGAVLIPAFGDAASDADANSLVSELYPGRNVVQLRIDNLAEGGGGIHCATQQQPAATA